jgi:toxin FitB
MYLLDTDVLSELRKTTRHPGVAAWIGAADAASLYLSVVTLGEVERGIARQRRQNPEFAARLAAWRDDLLRLHAERVLPVTEPIARRWGALSDQIGHGGADLLIAATGLDHGLTVVTRNIDHFEPTGVPVLNPFA